MRLWKTRYDSMEILKNDFKEQARVIEEVFVIVDECVDLLDKKSSNDTYHRVCGIALVKARNFALGSYSLILDGLGQEAGAMLRPFIEYNELITYFRLDPNRVQEFVDGNLPPAGKRAKLIKGHFHELRQYLNEHAAHSSFSYQSINHIFDKPDMKIRKEQKLLPKVLFRNMSDFFVQIFLMTIEAVNCLQVADWGCAESQAIKIDALRLEGISVFKLDDRLSNT